MDQLKSVRNQVFQKLWQHYSKEVPLASLMLDALQKRNDVWIEDHVAFRTLPGEHTGSHILQQIFELMGYERKDPYRFEDKKLNAFWMCPPDIHGHCKDASPKVFISEIELGSFSTKFQEIIHRKSREVVSNPIPVLSKHAASQDPLQNLKLIEGISSFLTQTPHWSRPTHRDYEILQKESEYAAWTLLFGNHINHFTLSVHLMETFGTIQALGTFLETDLRIPMNRSGGLVKGTQELRLEQIATLASTKHYPFQEGLNEVPYAFVEYALRYPLEGKISDGQWLSYYQGFVTSNADKIFESTFRS